MKNNGFTLIEILISTVIIFITLSLVYLTYYNLEKSTIAIDEKLKTVEIKSNFLNFLNENIKSAVWEEKSFSFASDHISFKGISIYSPYSYQYDFYTKQTEKGITLVEERTNLLTDEKIIIPVLENYKSIYFEFYDGQAYIESWNKEEIPVGMKIILSEGEEEIPYYIKLPVNTQKSSLPEK